jgi:hypothetical protein
MQRRLGSHNNILVWKCTFFFACTDVCFLSLSLSLCMLFLVVALLHALHESLGIVACGTSVKRFLVSNARCFVA